MTTTLPTPATAPGGPSRMRARAHVRTELAEDGRGRPRTRLAVLRSQAPLKLRPANARGLEPLAPSAAEGVRICLAAAAAGPMGGDDLLLEVEVGAGSTLVLTEASATLLLPGLGGTSSRTRVRIRVERGATFVWWPEPVIAAAGCHHVNDVDIELAGDARVVLREELLLGRCGEEPGQLRQTMRVRREGRALHAQQLSIGVGREQGPAVLGAHRAAGSLLVVDPALEMLKATTLEGDGVLMPLAAGGAVLAHALAGDSIGLRRLLAGALAALGPPWQPGPVHTGAQRRPSLREAG